MTITFSDGLSLVSVTVDNSGVTCDGTFFFFTDTNERDYKIPTTDIYSITNNQ